MKPPRNLLDLFDPPEDEAVAARRLPSPPGLKRAKKVVERRKTSRQGAAPPPEAALAALAVAQAALAVCDEWVAAPRTPWIYKRLEEARDAVEKAAIGAENARGDVAPLAAVAAFAAHKAAATAADYFRIRVDSAALSNVRDFAAAARRKIRLAEGKYSADAEKQPARRLATATAKREALEGLPMERRLQGLLAPSKDAAASVGSPPTHPPRLSDDEPGGEGWIELLRFVPRVVGRLGIAERVRDGSLKHDWLGSGGYAAAFELPDPMYVLKVTADPEDAYVAMKLAEAKAAIPGLIRTYTVFRIQLPFAVKTRLSPLVDVVYGMVTEKVLTLADHSEGDVFSTKELLIKEAVAASGVSEAEADRLFEETLLSALDYLFEVENNEESVEENLLRRASEGLTASPVEQDFRFGVAWCAANGILFGADVHHGNFAITWRDGKFVCVKSDLGHHSVQDVGRISGYKHASRQAARLPLAANLRPGQDRRS
jgi:hypothetical protein